MHNNNGFTLVELAIVMTIIGLLIGGILKGQQMIENSKLQAIVKEIQSFNAAFTLFRDKYANIPGDYPSATLRIPNCNASTSCNNGNSNGLVEPTLNVPWNGADISTDITMESVQFWKHLALSNLLTGIKGSANTVAAGETHPVPNFGGVYHSYSITSLSWYNRTGNIIGIRNTMNPPYANIAGQSVFTAKQAWFIDTKLDDGSTNSGTIITEAPGVTDVGCDDNGVYQLADQRKMCQMYIFW